MIQYERYEEHASNKLGLSIKRLREARDLTQGELAKRAGMTRSHISRIEKGTYEGYKQDNFERLARALELTPAELAQEIYGYKESRPSLKALAQQIHEVSEKYDLVEIQIKGIVPAGGPWSSEEQPLGYIEVPRGELEGIDMEGLYALRVSGDSLSGDGIFSGDYVIVSPIKNIIDGKIYVLRIDNEVCARIL